MVPDGDVYGNPSDLVGVSDAHVIDSLRACGVDWPDVFNLTWGLDAKSLNVFPKVHRMLISEILLELSKEEDADDYIDKKLHHIIVELLYILYEKQINDYIKLETEKMNAKDEAIHRHWK